MKYSDDFLDCVASAYRDALAKGKNELAEYLFNILAGIGVIRADGGPGSGNWGHEGRPGQVGGSAEGGGAHNRIEKEPGAYTSFSKMRKSLSTTHKIGEEDLKALKTKGTVLLLDGQKYVTAKTSGDTVIAVAQDTGEMVTNEDIQGKSARIFVPETSNKNYTQFNAQQRAELNGRLSSAARPESPQKADEMYREDVGKIWKNSDQDTRNALVRYTGIAYEKINTALRMGNGSGDSTTLERARLITNAIEKSELKNDSVFYRGVSTSGFEKLFGLPAGSLTEENVGGLVGRSRTENGFMSCGTTNGKGFTDKPVQMEILAPKGTKAMYVEPFSSCGNGSTNWDGVSTQKTFSDEQETIIQRGSRLSILSAEYYGGQYHIQAAVVSQKPKKLLT